MNDAAKWALTAAGGILIALLAWGGSTLVTQGNQLSAIQATQVQIIKTLDRTLDALQE